MTNKNIFVATLAIALLAIVVAVPVVTKADTIYTRNSVVVRIVEDGNNYDTYIDLAVTPSPTPTPRPSPSPSPRPWWWPFGPSPSPTPRVSPTPRPPTTPTPSVTPTPRTGTTTPAR